MSRGIRIEENNLDQAEAIVGSATPIRMLNLLRFRAQAQYPDQDQQTDTITGRDAYMTRYVPEFTSVATQIGSGAGTPVFLGAPLATVIGEPSSSPAAEREWDMVGVISYPNLAAFRQVVESPVYKERALEHRLASLEDWRLYAVVEFRI